MFQKILQKVLENSIGRFLNGLDSNNVKLGIWSGKILIENVTLKPEVIEKLALPINLKSSKIGKIELKIPWSKLSSSPIEVIINDIYITVAPQSPEEWDFTINPEQKLQLLVESCKDRIQDIYNEQNKIPKGEDKSYFDKLMIKVLDNIQISVTNIHFRWEQDNNEGNLRKQNHSWGITSQSLEITTTDESWNKQFIDRTDTLIIVPSINRLLKLKNLALYWNHNESKFYYKNEKQTYSEFMQSRIYLNEDGAVAKEYSNFIVVISSEVRFVQNSIKQSLLPLYQIDIQLNWLNLIIKKTQMKQFINMLENFTAYDSHKWIKNQLSQKMSQSTQEQSKIQYAELFQRIYVSETKQLDVLEDKDVQIMKYILNTVSYEDLLMWTVPVAKKLIKNNKVSELSQKKQIQKSKWANFWSPTSQKEEQSNLTETDINQIENEIENIFAIQKSEIVSDQRPQDSVDLKCEILLKGGSFQLKSDIDDEVNSKQLANKSIKEDGLELIYNDILCKIQQLADGTLEVEFVITSFQIRLLTEQIGQEVKYQPFLEQCKDPNAKEIQCFKMQLKKQFQESTQPKGQSDQQKKQLQITLKLQVQPFLCTYNLMVVKTLTEYIKTQDIQQDLKIQTWNKIQSLQDQTQQQVEELMNNKIKIILNIDIGSPTIILPFNQNNKPDTECWVISLGDLRLTTDENNQTDYEFYELELSSITFKYLPSKELYYQKQIPNKVLNIMQLHKMSFSIKRVQYFLKGTNFSEFTVNGLAPSLVLNLTTYLCFKLQEISTLLVPSKTSNLGDQYTQKNYANQSSTSYQLQINNLEFSLISSSNKMIQTYSIDSLCMMDNMYKYENPEYRPFFLSHQVHDVNAKDYMKIQIISRKTNPEIDEWEMETTCQFDQLYLNWKPDVILQLMTLFESNQTEIISTHDDNQGKSEDQARRIIIDKLILKENLKQPGIQKNPQQDKSINSCLLTQESVLKNKQKLSTIFTVDNKQMSETEITANLKTKSKLTITINQAKINLLHQQSHNCVGILRIEKFQMTSNQAPMGRFTSGQLGNAILSDICNYPNTINSDKDYLKSKCVNIFQKRSNKNIPLLIFEDSDYNEDTLNQSTTHFLNIKLSPIELTYMHQPVMRFIDFMVIQMMTMIQNPEHLTMNKNLLESQLIQLRRSQIIMHRKFAGGTVEKIFKSIFNPTFTSVDVSLEETSIRLRKTYTDPNQLELIFQKMTLSNCQSLQSTRLVKGKSEVKIPIWCDTYDINLSSICIKIHRDNKTTQISNLADYQIQFEKPLYFNEITELFPSAIVDAHYNIQSCMTPMIIDIVHQEYEYLCAVLMHNFNYDDLHDLIFIYDYEIDQFMAPNEVKFKILLPTLSLFMREDNTILANMELKGSQINVFMKRNKDVFMKFESSVIQISEFVQQSDGLEQIIIIGKLGSKQLFQNLQEVRAIFMEKNAINKTQIQKYDVIEPNQSQFSADVILQNKPYITELNICFYDVGISAQSRLAKQLVNWLQIAEECYPLKSNVSPAYYVKVNLQNLFLCFSTKEQTNALIAQGNINYTFIQEQPSQQTKNIQSSHKLTSSNLEIFLTPTQDSKKQLVQPIVLYLEIKDDLESAFLVRKIDCYFEQTCVKISQGDLKIIFAVLDYQKQQFLVIEEPIPLILDQQHIFQQEMNSSGVLDVKSSYETFVSFSCVLNSIQIVLMSAQQVPVPLFDIFFNECQIQFTSKIDQFILRVQSQIISSHYNSQINIWEPFVEMFLIDIDHQFNENCFPKYNTAIIFNPEQFHDLSLNINITTPIIYKLINLSQVFVDLTQNNSTQPIKNKIYDPKQVQQVRQGQVQQSKILSQLQVEIQSITISVISTPSKIIPRRKEIVLMNILGVLFVHITDSHGQTSQMNLSNIQIDSNRQTNCRYPVLLMAQNTEYLKKYRKPILTCLVKLSNDIKYEQYFKSIQIAIQPLTIKLTEGTLEDLYYMYAQYKDAKVGEFKGQKIQKVDTSQNQQICFFERVEIYPMILNLSFLMQEASGTGFHKLLKLPSTFLNIDEAKIKLHGYQSRNLQQTLTQFSTVLAQNYQSDMISNIGKLIGSMDILGNPIGLIRNVGNGFQDLWEMPAEGFLQGPIEGGIGIAKGVGSLTQGLVTGTFNSVQKITGGLAKEISAMSLDKQYQMDRVSKKQKDPKHLLEGVGQGMVSLFSGIEQGITGLIKQPLQGADQGGVEGFFKGTLKGLAGLIVKPVVGVMDFTSKTAEGIKNSANYFDDAHKVKRYRPPRVLYGVEQFYKNYKIQDSEIMELLQNINKQYFALELIDIVTQRDKNQLFVYLMTIQYFMLVDVRKQIVKFEIPWKQICGIVRVSEKQLHVYLSNPIKKVEDCKAAGICFDREKIMITSHDTKFITELDYQLNSFVQIINAK